MNNQREKKPPVNIKKLEGEEGEEHKQGPITYLDKNKGGGEGVSTKSKINLTQLILAVGLSVLVFVLISNFWLTPKKDALVLLENQKLLENQQANLEGTLAFESGRIENTIAAQANFATHSELSGFVSDSELAGLSGLITGIGEQVSSIESLVDDQGDRIVVLEEAINGTVSIIRGGFNYYISGNQLYVRVEYTGYYRFKFILIDETVQEYGFGDDLYLLEYYTKSYPLEGGEWIHKSLNGLRNALDSKYSDDLENYDVLVELLVGSTDSLGGTTEGW